MKNIPLYTDRDEKRTGGKMDRSLMIRILEVERPKIRIDEVSNEGDVVFSIDLKQFGLTNADFEKDPFYVTPFFNNFIGEFIVRQNIDEFANLLTEIPAGSYDKIVWGYNHTLFGAQNVDDNIKTFTMHISLIQAILTEDLQFIS